MLLSILWNRTANPSKLSFTDANSAYRNASSPAGSVALKADCKIRLRKATEEEARKILRSYSAHHDLAMTAIFGSQVHRLEDEPRGAANAKDMADATLIRQDAQHGFTFISGLYLSFK